MEKQIILASASPRRKELLELLKIPFQIHPSDVEEKVEEDILPYELAEQLSLIKAKDVAAQYQEGIVIGADTIVVLDDQILGKPSGEKEAFEMLSKLQGRQHEVFSGVTLIDAKTGKTLTSHQKTTVFMQPLSKAEIESYIRTKEPLDKAGSYGIQGIGSLFIERIEGDYFNVVGLPLSLLHSLLKELGVHMIKDLMHPKSMV